MFVLLIDTVLKYNYSLKIKLLFYCVALIMFDIVKLVNLSFILVELSDFLAKSFQK